MKHFLARNSLFSSGLKRIVYGWSLCYGVTLSS